ncbi:MAG: acyltransferase [Pseudomonadota bacterium]
MFRRIKNRLITKLGVLLHHHEQAIARQTLPKFANKPERLVIERPRRIVQSGCMTIGDDVYLGPGGLLVGVTQYPGPENVSAQEVTVKNFTPRISIGSRVSSTGGLQIAACDYVEIGDDVLFATNVNITDALHGYREVGMPFKSQAMERIRGISIGQGCWIGQNVVILPGTKIGHHCIVGANSVVSGEIPDRSIVMGLPGRVVKQWSDTENDWVAVNEQQ